MAEGKWISGLAPDTPVHEAAATVLRVRLEVVQQHLPRAIHLAEKDIEHVHQLRVATRRAGAALRIFRPLLPKKQYKKTRDTLRTIRRAAGAARDWDVFLASLRDFASLKEQSAGPTLDLLTGYAVGLRTQAQEQLTALQPLLDEPVFARLELSPGRSADGKLPATASPMAHQVLNELFGELQAHLDAKPTDPDDLHQLRISGKRLRYAMEVFAELFTPPFREALYPAVEQLQEILGTIQDCHVAAARLATLSDSVRRTQPQVAARVRPGLSAVSKELRSRTQSMKKAFRQWGKDWRKITRAHPLESLLLS